MLGNLNLKWVIVATSMVAFIFILSTGVQQAAFGSNPTVQTTYQINQNGDNFHFELPTTNCLQVDDSNDCLEWEYGPDALGKPIKTAVLTMTNSVKNMPSGWDYCTDTQSIQSFEKFVAMGLISLPKNPDLKSLGFAPLESSLDFNVYRELADSYEAEVMVGYLPNNQSRIKYQGWALICGSDANTISGSGWKFVTGKAVTLPASISW